MAQPCRRALTSLAMLAGLAACSPSAPVLAPFDGAPSESAPAPQIVPLAPLLAAPAPRLSQADADALAKRAAALRARAAALMARHGASR